jgi:nicotinamide riboside transporter PnuC
MPLYVSLIIGMLQSRVNRFAPLIGSINSIVYGAVYIYFKLYGSAFSAFLFSCPIQLLTFIRWNKNKSGNSTVLRKLGARKMALLSAGCAVSLVALWVILPLIGSDYVDLDGVTTILGVVVYFLTMFAYIEYPIFMVVNGLLGIALNAQMAKDNPSVLPHLIFSVYSLMCIIFAAFEARKLYESQQKEKFEKGE